MIPRPCTLDGSLDGRPRPFRVVCFGPDPVEDAAVIGAAAENARRQGGSDSDPAGKKRDPITLFKTRYLGALSELLLRAHLDGELGPGFTVRRGPFTDYQSHVDLVAEHAGRRCTLEVRGSFPYKPLEWIVREGFHVIGPYSTAFKRGEGAKDVYLRTLINQNRARFTHERRHTLLFTGGAEHALFGPFGEDTTFEQEKALYRGIRPMTRAHDAVEVVDLIRRFLQATP